jgi:hypothetical protein
MDIMAPPPHYLEARTSAPFPAIVRVRGEAKLEGIISLNTTFVKSWDSKQIRINHDYYWIFPIDKLLHAGQWNLQILTESGYGVGFRVKCYEPRQFSGTK